MEKFYYEENLHPLLGGTTRIRIGKDPDELMDGVVYIMYDAENNSIAIMEYTSDQVCALGFIHDVEFDVDTLKEYLGYER